MTQGYFKRQLSKKTTAEKCSQNEKRHREYCQNLQAIYLLTR